MWLDFDESVDESTVVEMLLSLRILSESFLMYWKILLKSNVYNHQVVALRMNQSNAFKFWCEFFYPKLTNSYSNCQRSFNFS